MLEDKNDKRSRIFLQLEKLRPFKLITPEQRKESNRIFKTAYKALRREGSKNNRHSSRRIAFMRYSYYDLVFKYFVEQALDAEFVALPAPTRRTLELGSKHSNDFVCAPFKHILGDYLEALELGAQVLVQFVGPCRLGYYGELQESILRDLGYEFEMLNFAEAIGKSPLEFLNLCKRTINPRLSVPQALRGLLAALKMLEYLDEIDAYNLANAGFECEPGAHERVIGSFHHALRIAKSERDINEAYRNCLDRLKEIKCDKPAAPLRVGIVGEYFTAIDPHSNLELEAKLLAMGVEVHRMLNVTNRNLHYHERNLQASISEYVRYDMGPTSTMTIAAALKYAQDGLDGIVHAKSSGCTPEIDCMPVLQRIASDHQVPVLYLSYDQQTSDTGLATRLEAFYDMLAMRKGKALV